MARRSQETTGKELSIAVLSGMTATDNSPEEGKNDSGIDYEKVAHQLAAMLIESKPADLDKSGERIAYALRQSAKDPGAEHLRHEIKQSVREFGYDVWKFRQETGVILYHIGAWPVDDTYLDQAWILVDQLSRWEKTQEGSPDAALETARDLVDQLEKVAEEQ